MDGAIRQTWSGTVRLDAAQDQGPGCAAAERRADAGSYRTFTATSGSVDVTVAVRSTGERLRARRQRATST